MVRTQLIQLDNDAAYKLVSDHDMSLRSFLDKALHTPRKTAATGPKRRLYAKDWDFASFKRQWKEALFEALPDRITPGNPYDMLGRMPEKVRPDVLMAYVGQDGTRTPIHNDKVGSIAFNCVMWASRPGRAQKVVHVSLLRLGPGREAL